MLPRVKGCSIFEVIISSLPHNIRDPQVAEFDQDLDRVFIRETHIPVFHP